MRMFENNTLKQYKVTISDLVWKFQHLNDFVPNFEFYIYVYNLVDADFVKTNNTQQLWTPQVFMETLNIYYANRKVLISSDFPNGISESDKEFMLLLQFRDLYTKYVSRMQDAWSKIVCSRAIGFSPVANYDKYLTGKTEYIGNEKTEETPTGTETNTRKEKGSETDTFSHGATTETNTTSNTTFDSSNFYDSSKNVDGNLAYTDTNTRNYTNRETETVNSFDNRKTTTTKSFENRKDENTLHEFGNIGVAETTKILQNYLDMYKKDLILEIMSDFIDSVSYY